EKIEAAQLSANAVGHHLCQVEGRLDTFESRILVENESIRRDLEDEEEARISLQKQVDEMKATIEAMSAKIKMLETVHREKPAAPAVEKEYRIDGPKPTYFKGTRDAQEVENFLWHLEKFFKRNKVTDDDDKITTAEAYLTEMALIWWRRKEAEMEKGLCTIATWAQFRTEFKRAFFPNNVVEEARRKLRELRQTGSVRANIKDFTSLTFQIPDLTDEMSLFFFKDGLQSWAKAELERRHVTTLDEAIAEVESMTDFKHDKGKAKEHKPSHPRGSVDRGKTKEGFRPKRAQMQSTAHEQKGQQSKDKACYICGGTHFYLRCPQMRNLGAMVRDYGKQGNPDQPPKTDDRNVATIRRCAASA
ncbi:retrotransposon gag domain-containing protein, partial [Corynebacterium sp. MC-02]|uniref:retrotransposon gag family protein n=1 Tax=Corynebacterium pseudokroppenstedtii TaxID=2804917 RepID=UPI001F33B0F5